MSGAPLWLFGSLADAAEAFARFHSDNPHVYRELVRLTRQAKRRGITRIGMRMLWETCRWNQMLRTVHDEGELKLNDHLPPYYARLIMRMEPDLDGMFELRELRAK